MHRLVGISLRYSTCRMVLSQSRAERFKVTVNCFRYRTLTAPAFASAKTNPRR